MKNYDANRIKRRAKGIKREKHIPHHEALDQSSQEAGFQNWKHFLNSESAQNQTIRPGNLVRFKEQSWLAIAVDQSDELVTCYTHWGTLVCMRWEISICPDQTRSTSFRPMRIVLPYGKWTSIDGTEVLFNRDYRPIWKKQPNGTVVAADPNEWVSFEKQEYLFGDHNTPDEDRDSKRICTNQLRDWGVQDKAPVMLGLFRNAVAASDLTLLGRLSLHDN